MNDPLMKLTLAKIYDDLALDYEHAVVPIFRPIAKRLIQLIDLRPGWQVLDAGTGTGLIALLSAPRVGKEGKVIGVDGAEKMLEVAREKAARFGFTQCEFRRGDLEALEFSDAQFNAVLSQFALHHTDPTKSLHELHRVLMPGGALVIQDWMESPNPPNAALFDALQKYRVTEPDESLAIARRQSERAWNFRVNYAKPERIERVLKEVGFERVEAREEKHNMRVANVDTYIAMASAAPLIRAELNALSAEVSAEIFNQARERLRSFETSNGFEWSYHVLAVVAHK
jgi:ubiquinone/menaquinone biosynthesis C-methylase UbiE